MAKNSRGKSLYKLPSRGRGTCPICYSTRIKLLKQVKQSDGTSIKVCKRCTAADQAKIDQAKIELVAYRRKHRKSFNQQRVITTSSSSSSVNL